MAYKRKGCGPQALGSPIKQQAKSISKKMSESDGVKITEDLIDERLESRKVRDSLKKNFRYDGSYDPKLFPPIKDDSGKIVTPGYDPKKEKGYKKNAQKASPAKFKGANSKNSDCWKGYKKVGTKPSPTKPGVTVNNCVKK